MRKMNEANWNALRPVIYYGLPVLLVTGIFAWFDYPILNFILDHDWVNASCIWVCFSLFSGWFEAYYYNAKIWSNIDIKINEHIIWNSIRFFVWISLLGWTGWLTSGALVLLFPFVHDGKYFQQRNKLYGAVYDHGWWSNPSHDSTAIVDLNVYVRSLLFIAGIYLLLLFNYQAH